METLRTAHQAVDWLSRTLNRGAEWLLTALCMAMALVIGLQVLFRYGFNHSLFWSEELGRMLLVWMTFLGASVAYRRGAHVGVDFVTSRLPAGVARGLRMAVLAVSLFFFASLAWWGMEFSHFVRLQQTTTLGMSRLIPAAMLPVSGALLFVHGLALALGELAGGREGQQ